MSENIKLKWYVQPAPTGRWKSFHRRGWPTAELPDGHMVAHIDCEDDYVPRKAAAGEHRELTVRVAFFEADGRRSLRTIKRKASCLSEAKAMTQRFFEQHPEYLVNRRSMES